MFFAEALDCGEVAGGCGDDAGLALEGLEDYGGDFVLLERGFEGCDVAKGNFVGFGEHGAETIFPKSVSHEGESAAGQAVECAFGVDDAVAAGEDAGELDDGLDALAAGAAEEGFG